MIKYFFLLLLAIETSASTITAHVTADNGFSLYTGNADGSELTYIGRSSSQDGWWTSDAFTFTHTDGNYIYLAGWSDNYWAQGVLGQFDVEGGGTILTGTNWEVHLTFQDNSDPSSIFLPPISDLASEIAENTWSNVTYTVANGSNPWGLRPDISSSSDWMWGSPLISDGGNSDGGSGYGEYQIFRVQVGVSAAAVPEPKSLAMFGLGLACLTAFCQIRKRV